LFSGLSGSRAKLGTVVSCTTCSTSVLIDRCISGSKMEKNGQGEPLSALALIRQSLRSTSTAPGMEHLDGSAEHTFVVVGASGDLAKKKIYPTLWWLFRDGLLPNVIRFFGYARSNLTVEQLREKCHQYMKVTDGEKDLYEKFWKLNAYFAGSYDQRRDFEMFNQELAKTEGRGQANRIFYLALPPSVFEIVTANIRQTSMASSGWTRVIVEKPFGKDSESSLKLSNHLAQLFTEEQIYRIDHYLGKEMVQNLMSLRFGNRVFGPTWNRESIASVMISFKEPFGTQGRGGYSTSLVLFEM